MKAISAESVDRLAFDAAEVAALANLLSGYMANDPDTTQIGEAIGGIGTLALQLSNKLFELADPNA